jgi:hypothetical protein
MKLQKFPVFLAMATLSSIPLVCAVSSVQAADFVFSATFSNGYSAKGSFTTKPGTPPSFSETNPNFPNAPFTTQYLQSTSLSIFDSTNTLLQTGSPVIDGISTDGFLRLDYDNSLTPNLPALNVNTETPTQNPYYFIGNNVAPDNTGTPVPPGSTTYNLFLYNRITDKYTFLGSTPSIQATSVPESSSVISLLGFAALGVGSAFKRRKPKL